MIFYLGTHETGQAWFDMGLPLFVSRRRLLARTPGVRGRLRTNLPRATTGWALDSGGFTELSLYHEWRTTPAEYIADVRRIVAEVGRVDWVAPQDWMVEPVMLAKTGLTVEDHQARTVANFLRLRDQLGAVVAPVLQGWTRDDYHRCWSLYATAGVDLEAERVVGLGSVCRRQNMAEAGVIVRSLQPLRLHGFGVKLGGLESFGDALASADSMAWSYWARRDPPLPGCTHRNCANCPRYALRWHDRVLAVMDQQRLDLGVAV